MFIVLNGKKMFVKLAPDDGAPSGGTPPAETPVVESPVAEAPAVEAPSGSWTDSLPESVRDWEEVKNSDSSEKFFDQVSNMRSALGQSIRIPTEDASDEVHTEFRKKLTDKVTGLVKLPAEGDTDGWNDLYGSLGRPADATGYTAPENLSDAGITDERFGHFAGMAHKYGLTKTQFEGMISEIGAGDAAQLAEQRSAIEANSARLRGEWGAAYDERVGMAQKVVKQFFPEVNPELMNASEIRSFHEMAKAFGTESSQVAFQGDGNSPKVSPSEAHAQIGEIRGNKNHAWHHPSSPDHKAAKAKMDALYEVAYPEGNNEAQTHKTFGV